MESSRNSYLCVINEGKKAAVCWKQLKSAWLWRACRSATFHYNPVCSVLRLFCSVHYSLKIAQRRSMSATKVLPTRDDNHLWQLYCVLLCVSCWEFVHHLQTVTLIQYMQLAQKILCLPPASQVNLICVPNTFVLTSSGISSSVPIPRLN